MPSHQQPTESKVVLKQIAGAALKGPQQSNGITAASSNLMIINTCRPAATVESIVDSRVDLMAQLQRDKKQLSHHEVIPAQLPLGMQGVPTNSPGAVNLIIDRDKVNHFKQHKLQQLIEVIRAEGEIDSNYADCFGRYMRILSEFKNEGMQMLIFKHKEPDVQQSTLVHKSIQTYRPPPSDEESKGEKTPRIPAFLMALSSLFQTDDLRPFLEDDNQFNNTPLHYAIKHGFIEVAQFLIHRCRVNINVSNKMGNTPLHMAVLNN